MRVLLFDIDGTLIHSDRAGRLALAAALNTLYGATGGLDGYDMGGKTDARIVSDLLSTIGLPDAEIPHHLLLVYEVMAEKALDIYPKQTIKPCVGVTELLDALENESEILIGLLTGNSHLTAPLKLAAAGIDPGRFSVSVFGSEALDRDLLPPIAMKRASELTGHTFTGDNTVIIGDTPADIQCARAGNATAVSVACGWHTAAELAPYNPDFLFEDFGDTPEVLTALLGL